MIKTFKYKKNSTRDLKIFLSKRNLVQKNKKQTVLKIIKNVKQKGDSAVLYYEKKFSKIKIKSSKVIFSNKELSKISKKLDRKIKKAIDLAFNRIKNFHSKQTFSSFRFKDKYKNELSYKYSALNKVGVYVPGGQQVILAQC